MQNLHFFAGGNTARGFESCFEDILPVHRRKRMYFIKGGPGVGKSSLMRRFAQTAEEKGLRVEFFHCSSDPDSLDGVALPERGVGMMDATAPHSYDPVIPGARDTLISLGDFLDEKALAPHAGEIRRMQREISARFARCYRYLAAAREVYAAAPAGVENADKAAELEAEWVKLLPKRGGRGEIRRLFGEAFTPKGRVQITELADFDRRAAVEVPFGAHASGLMERMARQAQARGLDAVLLPDPLSPEHAVHVLVPAHGVAFCTARHGENALPADALFDLSGGEKEESFDRNAAELLCQRALEQLASAKKLHDELEQFYVRSMDFAKWEQVLAKLLTTLDEGV